MLLPTPGLVAEREAGHRGGPIGLPASDHLAKGSRHMARKAMGGFQIAWPAFQLIK